MERNRRIYAFDRFNRLKGANKSGKFKNVTIAFLLLSLPLAFAIRNKKSEPETENKNKVAPSYFSAKTQDQNRSNFYIHFPKRNSKQPFKEHFDLASRVTGVKKALLYAHAEKESSFRNKVISNKGAFGVMQITYGAYCDAKKYAATRYDMAIPSWEEVKFNPKWNIFVGAAKIAHLHERFNPDAAILAYYAGAYDTRKGIEEHGLENYIARLEKSARPWRRKAEYYKDVKSKIEKYMHLDKLIE